MKSHTQQQQPEEATKYTMTTNAITQHQMIEIPSKSRNRTQKIKALTVLIAFTAIHIGTCTLLLLNDNSNTNGIQQMKKEIRNQSGLSVECVYVQLKQKSRLYVPSI